MKHNQYLSIYRRRNVTVRRFIELYWFSLIAQFTYIKRHTRPWPYNMVKRKLKLLYSQMTGQWKYRGIYIHFYSSVKDWNRLHLDKFYPKVNESILRCHCIETSNGEDPIRKVQQTCLVSYHKVHVEHEHSEHRHQTWTFGCYG
jgi:hypothetical protein